MASPVGREGAGLHFQLILLFVVVCKASPQLDLPPISSTQRNGYGYVSSTQTPINSPGNQYDVNQFSSASPNYNNQFSTARPNTNNFPSSTPYSRINPDINNNGYPSIDYGNSRNPSSTARPYDANRDDRIDINNDPNFRRNDPNFVRNDPNYVGSNPYDFNNRGDNNNIDNRFNQVDLQQIRDFLHRAEEQASKECTNNVAAQWNFETDVNDATQHAAVSIIILLYLLILFSITHLLFRTSLIT